MGEYLCEAASVSGFVQQLAVAYLANGYLQYVTGEIPEGKDARQVDRKLIDAYGLEVSRATRSRRKALGLSNVQYLRFDRFFVLCATDAPRKWEHPFYQREKAIRDFRLTPLRFAGYSIGYRRERGRPPEKWHPSVSIAEEVFKELMEEFLYLSVHRSLEKLVEEFKQLRFEPYAPVRSQYLRLLREVNRRRKASGYELVPFTALRLQRFSVPPFAIAARMEAA